MGMQEKFVLVVEDEGPIREMVKFAHERANFRVATAPRKTTRCGA